MANLPPVTMQQRALNAAAHTYSTNSGALKQEPMQAPCNPPLAGARSQEERPLPCTRELFYPQPPPPPANHATSYANRQVPQQQQQQQQHQQQLPRQPQLVNQHNQLQSLLMHQLPQQQQQVQPHATQTISQPQQAHFHHQSHLLHQSHVQHLHQAPLEQPTTRIQVQHNISYLPMQHPPQRALPHQQQQPQHLQRPQQQQQQHRFLINQQQQQQQQIHLEHRQQQQFNRQQQFLQQQPPPLLQNQLVQQQPPVRRAEELQYTTVNRQRASSPAQAPIGPPPPAAPPASVAPAPGAEPEPVSEPVSEAEAARAEIGRIEREIKILTGSISSGALSLAEHSIQSLLIDLNSRLKEQRDKLLLAHSAAKPSKPPKPLEEAITSQQKQPPREQSPLNQQPQQALIQPVQHHQAEQQSPIRHCCKLAPPPQTIFAPLPESQKSLNNFTTPTARNHDLASVVTPQSQLGHQQHSTPQLSQSVLNSTADTSFEAQSTQLSTELSDHSESEIITISSDDAEDEGDTQSTFAQPASPERDDADEAVTSLETNFENLPQTPTFEEDPQQPPQLLTQPNQDSPHQQQQEEHFQETQIFQEQESEEKVEEKVEDKIEDKVEEEEWRVRRKKQKKKKKKKKLKTKLKLERRDQVSPQAVDSKPPEPLNQPTSRSPVGDSRQFANRTYLNHSSSSNSSSRGSKNSPTKKLLYCKSKLISSHKLMNMGYNKVYSINDHKNLPDGLTAFNVTMENLRTNKLRKFFICTSQLMKLGYHYLYNYTRRMSTKKQAVIRWYPILELIAEYPLINEKLIKEIKRLENEICRIPPIGLEHGDKIKNALNIRHEKLQQSRARLLDWQRSTIKQPRPRPREEDSEPLLVGMRAKQETRRS